MAADHSDQRETARGAPVPEGTTRLAPPDTDLTSWSGAAVEEGDPRAGDVGTPTGMGDADGLGGTSGAVARGHGVAPGHEGDLPGELGPGAGRSSEVK